MTNYNIMHTEGGVSVITFIGEDGEPRLVTDESYIYADVARYLRNGWDPTDLLDESLDDFIDDDRLDYDDEDGFSFDGQPVHENVQEVILRYQREGRDATNLIRFLERLNNNPSFRSREQLFTWTQAKEIVIDTDGYLIGYKGVSNDMLSIHAGEAVVDGREVVGNIPNVVGSVISMPRSQVQDDPNIGCHKGLHVGNFSYARGFGSIVLEVRVDPADVVSVPSDCSFQKLRTCRYEVIAVHTSDEDDVADTYEPEATAADPDFDSFMDVVPEKFLASLRSRIASRFSRKNKDAE